MKRLLWLLLLPSFVSAQTITNGVTATGTVQMGAAANAFIGIAISPATASVVVNATQTFTFTITNDVSNQGANLILICSPGSPCGSLSATNVKNGGTVTYNAPPNVPAIPSVTLTATSVQDSTRFTSAIFSIVPAQGPPPNAAIVRRFPPSAFQTTAATNTFQVPSSQGSTLDIGIAGTAGTVFSGATDNLGQTWTIGCQNSLAGIGSVAHIYKQNSQPGVTSVTTATSAATGALGIMFWDVANASANAPVVSCNSSATPTTAPQPTGVLTQSGGVILGLLGGANVSAVTTPNFTFTQVAAGNGASDSLATSTGTLAPTYTQSSSGWAGGNISFAAGNSPAIIGVNITPLTANVAVSTTQVFTVNVFNDAAHAGTAVSLVGSGCSGAACGTLSSSSVAEGGSVTYTGPSSVPGASPTVNLTARSVTDGTKVAVSTITITSAPVLGITVAPVSSSTTASGSTISLTPTITNDSGTGNATVAFTGSGCSGMACGTLSTTTVHTGSAVTYTPPPTTTTTLNVQVLFTSVTDSTKTVTATISVSPVTSGSACTNPCAAFPGAQGAGAASHGGRGGPIGGSHADGTPRLLYITSAGDSTNSITCDSHGVCQGTSGTSTFRDCTLMTGPTTCMFRTGGMDVAGNRLTFNNPFITVAGQTAPPNSGGFWYKPGSQDNFIWMSTHDIIIRYIGCSGANSAIQAGVDSGDGCFLTTNGTNNYNLIVDHVSMRWWGNKAFIWGSNVGGGPTHDVTMDWSLVYEPNYQHPVCVMFDDTDSNAINDINQDFHHNVLINCDHRTPLLDTRSGMIVSNIAYDYGVSNYALLTQGGGIWDIIGNLFVGGLSNNFYFNGVAGNSFKPFMFNTNQSGNNRDGDMPGPPSIYMAGNAFRSDPTQTTGVASNQQSLTANGSEGGQSSTPASSGYFRTTPRAAEQFPITAEVTTNLPQILLPTVGLSQVLNCDGTWATIRDTQDTRVINQYQTNGVGNYFNYQYSDPTKVAGTPCPITLDEGLYDGWVQKWGLPTGDPELWRKNDPNWNDTYENVMLAGLKP